MADFELPTELVVLEEHEDLMAAEVSDLPVIEAHTLPRAAHLLTRVRDWIRTAEADRKALVGPLNDHVKFINEAYKVRLAPWHEFDDALSKRIADFTDEQRRLTAEAERETRETLQRQQDARAEETAKLADALGVKPEDIEKPVSDLVIKVESQTVSDRTGGEVQSRRVLRWGVDDISRVHHSLLKADDGAIREAVAEQRANLEAVGAEHEDLPDLLATAMPGLRFWWDTVIATGGKMR